MMNPLKTEIKYLKGVGEKRAKILHKLNIFNVEDLMEHIPRNYIHRDIKKSITYVEPGTRASVVGKIVNIESSKSFRRKRQFNITVTDGSDSLLCTWFQFGNWLTKKFKIGEKIWVSGLISSFRGIKQIIHPDFELLSNETKETPQNKFWRKRKILPVYPLTKGISIKLMRKLIYNAFYYYHNSIYETLPEAIRCQFKFQDRNSTLQKIHFPTPHTDISTLKSRLIFEELFYEQLLMARSRNARKVKSEGIQFKLKKTYTTQLKHKLPFELTNAQIKAIKEIIEDMSSPHQMTRLLQGDVGSGKTIVTIFAMLLALENDYQSALLAPTEILAEQHFISINDFLKKHPDINIALIKGGKSKEKDKLKEQIRNGKTDIVIGTHAIIEKDVAFKNLGLAVIDEQHRFGVLQRGALSKKAQKVDALHLSATPIPRSLALTAYGDMEISVIDELPPGRKPIKTFWKGANSRSNIYQNIKDRIKDGSQAYIVCPLVEESDKIDLLDAETLFNRLKADVFSDIKISMLHGKMKNSEKDQIMKDFKQGKTKILVATTVIEVGIDVPNATIMVIEHAERFGLSQLHQLRGRIGRSNKQSYCYLIAHHPISKEARERLTVMVETNNGFKIAEKDLELRGPGEFLGTVQSGLPEFKFANLYRDQNLLQKARQLAFEIIKNDYDLQKEKNKIIKQIYFQKYKNREKLLNF